MGLSIAEVAASEASRRKGCAKIEEKYMLRKLLILSVLLFTFIFASAAVAAEQIRIGIVVGQATAELSCEDEFTVCDSYGKMTTMPKGKYFIHAQQGKLFFDGHLHADLFPPHRTS